MSRDQQDLWRSNNNQAFSNNRTDLVYETLREEIARGVLRPNHRIVEVDVAERLRVSRTPVREALYRLAADGLVTTSRRTWMVRDHTAVEIEHVYELRMALEGMAARLAAERASDSILRRLAQRHRVHAVGPDDAQELLISTNDRFHLAIYEASGNQELVNAIRTYRYQYYNFRVAHLYTPSEAITSLAEHEEILSAVVSRNGQAAEDAVRSHLATARRKIVNTFFEHR